MPTSEELKPHQAAYKQYLAQTVSLRPVLFRYCRHLAENVWDAEDLVRETLLGGYARLGWTYFEIADWRAYLLRAATNLWLNEQRRNGRVIYSEAPLEVEAAEETQCLEAEVKEALLILVENLAPPDHFFFFGRIGPM